MFFYKFTFHLLRISKDSILMAEELTEIANCIKQCQPKDGFTKLISAIPIVNKLVNQGKWSRIIEEAKSEKINETGIKELMMRYDLEHKRFKYSFLCKY